MHTTRLTFSVPVFPLTMAVFLIAAGIPAQSGPATINAAARDLYLSNATSTSTQPTLQGITSPAPLWPNGVGNFRQVNFTKSGISGLAAGEYAMTMTVNSLNTVYTGLASVATGVILGKYVAGTSPSFTPTTLAMNMNPTTGSVFGLMIEPRDGLYASVDWSAGPVLAYRPNQTSQFGVPVPLTDSQGSATLGTFVDPAVCYVDGKLSVLYVAPPAINCVEITPTFQGGQLTKATYGVPKAVTLMSGDSPHSPSPIIGPNGNAQGLFLAGATGSDSDSYFQGLLSSKDAAIKLWDNPNWQNNGGTVGGTFFFRNTADSSSIWRIDGAFLVGSRTPLLGTASISVFCTPGTIAPIVTSTLAASNALGPAVTLPGFLGQYGLGAVLLTFAQVAAVTADELAVWTAAVPNNPALKGIRVPIQALASRIGSPAALTNTSHLEIL